jgi:hypothetical protein
MTETDGASWLGKLLFFKRTWWIIKNMFDLGVTLSAALGLIWLELPRLKYWQIRRLWKWTADIDASCFAKRYKYGERLL